MSYTPPPAFVPNQILTAAEENVLSDDIAFLAAQSMVLSGVGPPAVGPPPTLGVTPFLIQGASTVVALSSGGGATISFPNAFPNGLLTVIPTPGDDAGDETTIAVLEASTTIAYFSILVRDSTGTEINGLDVRINWIAIGY